MAVITGNMLVDKFRQYEYVRYTWGGASPDTGWDCSGACNYIIGWLFKLDIPGFGPGAWGPGAGHGPVVGDWIQWVGVTRGVFGPVVPAPGDLIAWGPNVHMGMAIDGTRFVSAANPNDGTIEANIGSFFTWAPFVLRLLQTRTGATTPPGLPIPRLPAASSMTNWSGTISATAARANGAASNLSRFALATRRE